MFGVTYESEDDALSALIDEVNHLANNMLFCGFVDKRLVCISGNFKEFIHELLDREGYVVISKKGNDLCINNKMIIKITIPISKEMLLLWYKGNEYAQKVCLDLHFNSCLLKGIFE